MKRLCLLAATAVIAAPAFAEENRQLDAHEHGVGQLDIAFEGGQIAMELHAPGADIVGFEYQAKSAEDRAAIDAAVAALAKPLDLFVLADAAGCSVVEAAAKLESEDDHDAHDHEEHADDDHKEHAEHDHKEHAEHDHGAHKEHAEDDHAGHEDHAEHADDDKKEHDHAGEASHTEFHAAYLLDCADPTAVTEITFAYFVAFPNALELEIQLVADSGAKGFEVTRDAPTLDLRGMF